MPQRTSAGRRSAPDRRRAVPGATTASPPSRRRWLQRSSGIRPCLRQERHPARRPWTSRQGPPGGRGYEPSHSEDVAGS
eukprot:9683866-Lingulodinium_polyedra.AAC.1